MPDQIILFEKKLIIKVKRLTAKDWDGDGKKESSSKEHAGSVHNAIQRKKGGNHIAQIQLS